MSWVAVTNERAEMFLRMDVESRVKIWDDPMGAIRKL
jgi:hypothetical protein